MIRSDRAAVLRILSQYKRLVLLGKVALPLAEARRLIGPDCAFHLYGRNSRRAARRARRTRRHGDTGRGLRSRSS
jgi:hypothetical protein